MVQCRTLKLCDDEIKRCALLVALEVSAEEKITY